MEGPGKKHAVSSSPLLSHTLEGWGNNIRVGANDDYPDVLDPGNNNAPDRPEHGDGGKGKEEADAGAGSETYLPVGPNTIHVMGETDTTSICYIPLEPPDFPPVDADMLRVLVCSRIDHMFPGLLPATMALLSHPERKLLYGPHCLVHGGSTVHLASMKARGRAEPSVVFYRDLHLEIPEDQDPVQYACELLGLPLGSHKLTETVDNEKWLTPIAQPPSVPLRVITDNSGYFPPPAPVVVQTTSGAPVSGMTMEPLPPRLELPSLRDMLAKSSAPSRGSQQRPLKLVRRSMPYMEGLEDKGFECAWGEANGKSADDGIVIHDGDDGDGDIRRGASYYERGFDDEDDDDEDDEDIKAERAARIRYAYGSPDEDDNGQGFIDTYDPDRPYDTGEEPFEDDPPPPPPPPPVSESWDSIVHMPDGTRMLHAVSPYGSLPRVVLEEVCATRGWTPADYTLLLHDLPVAANIVHGNRSYDMRSVGGTQGPSKGQ
jgi:hypothetical protein